MTSVEAFHLVISLASLAMTLYFWLVVANNRRPRLAAYWLERKSLDTSQADASPGSAAAVGQKIEFAVVNLSDQVNVLYGVRVQILTRDGTWVGVADHGFHPQGVRGFEGYPVNLLPRRLSRVWAWVWVPVPPGDTTTPASDLLSRVAAEPLEVRVELRAARGGTFVCVVGPPAKAG